jgi:hypothetical protein
MLAGPAGRFHSSIPSNRPGARREGQVSLGKTPEVIRWPNRVCINLAISPILSPITFGIGLGVIRHPGGTVFLKYHLKSWMVGAMSAMRFSSAH